MAARARRQFADGRTTSAVARLTLSSALNLSPAFVWIPRERVCARSSRRGRSTRSRSLRKRATLMRRLPSPFLSLRLDSDPAGINCECAPTQRRHFTRQTVSSRQNELVSIEKECPPFTAMRYLRPHPAAPVRSCPCLSAPLPMNLRTKP